MNLGIEEMKTPNNQQPPDDMDRTIPVILNASVKIDLYFINSRLRVIRHGYSWDLQ